jgi:hypothetical protein
LAGQDGLDWRLEEPIPLIGCATQRSGEGKAMRFNLFEGARRISMTIGALWVCGWVASAALTEPYVLLGYRIDGLGAAPVRDDQCGENDDKHWLDIKDDKGRPIRVKLCFKAIQATNGEWLIPYAPADNGRWWLARRNSDEVKRHMAERERAFNLPPQGNAEATRMRWNKKVEAWEFAATGASVGLVVGWFLMTVIGWIIRGFLGIPQGRDARPID